MNDNLIRIIALAAFCLAEIHVLIDSVHFFQLNSYRHDTHRKYLRQNPKKVLLPLIFALLAFGLSFVLRSLFPVCLALLALFSIPKKGKKPLVFTARVKRMLLTAFVITAAPAALGYVFIKNDMIFYGVIAALTALSSVIMLIADGINKPMEKAINLRYTLEAKKILRSCPDLKIIGITGSYGKTSVKYYLTTLLEAKYNVLMTPASFNTPMGIVKTIRGDLKATHEVFVCEMGAKWVGDIKELCDIVHPSAGVITSVGPQHLESFGSLENVKKTKFELAAALPENGLLFLNADDENVTSYPVNRPYISYSVEGKGDYNGENIAVSDKGTTFTLRTKDGETEEFSTSLIGRHNVLNIVGAIAVAHTMGVSLKALKGQVRKLEGVPHRLALSNNGRATIIDDAYNSNPFGSKAAIDVLALFEGYKICITPGMVELGSEQFELNKKFGEYMADVCDYVILVGKKQAEPMLAGLKEKGYDENNIYVADTINEALDRADRLNTYGQKKVILLENDLPDNY